MLGDKTYLIAWPLVLLYYLYGTQILLKASRMVMRRVQSSKHPFLDMEHSIRFTLAALSQCGFCALLIPISGVSLGQLGWSSFRPMPLLFGFILGLGEMALGSFLCYIAMQAVMLLAPASVPSRVEDWLALLHAGWMREIISTFDTAPPAVSGGAITLYVTGEETIFRGVLVTVALPLGPVAAVATSTLFFSLIQTLHMPSWRSGLFPVIGALVTGTIHATLFVLVPEIWPLIVAHLTLFVAGVL